MIFTLIDPFTDCIYHTDRLDLMIRQAEKIGAARFQIVEGNALLLVVGAAKFICHVEKVEGVWKTSDPAYQNCELMRKQPVVGGV